MVAQEWAIAVESVLSAAVIIFLVISLVDYELDYELDWSEWFLKFVQLTFICLGLMAFIIVASRITYYLAMYLGAAP